MKKLLAILTVTAIITACNDNSDTTETSDDSIRIPSTVTPSDTATVPLDTSLRAADTTMKK